MASITEMAFAPTQTKLDSSQWLETCPVVKGLTFQPDRQIISAPSQKVPRHEKQKMDRIKEKQDSSTLVARGINTCLLIIDRSIRYKNSALEFCQELPVSWISGKDVARRARTELQSPENNSGLCWTLL